MKKNFSRYVIDFNSKYYYKDTEILKNKFQIKNLQKLQKVESDLTYFRLIQLNNKPLNGDFDINHLLKIHEYIFQDIYEFAGKIREEEISKGGTVFCKVKFINQNIEYLFNELKIKNFFLGLSKEDFIRESAIFLSDLNMIHPFIEGNGRAIREFYRCLAQKNNYNISWEKTTSKQLLNAFIESVSKNTENLQKIIKKILSEY
ncbi:MAG: Fic family protein [Candidatus Muiribacteriota bacterium]